MTKTLAEYGTVVSSFEGPSTRQFSFVINPGTVVRRGQFVQVRTGEGEIMGRVADVIKTNRYFMRPESVKEYQSSGKAMEEIFPVSDWEYLVAEVSIIGLTKTEGNNVRFGENLFPPSPGSVVKEPDLKLLSGFFGLDDGGIHLGSLRHHDLDVRLNMTRLLQKHLAILAISGAGKSFLTSVLIEEMLTREIEQGQMAVVVLDSHGEYTSFADDSTFSAKCKVFPASDLRIGLPNLSHHQLGHFVPKLSFAQIRELSKIMRSMSGSYGITDIIAAVEESDIKAATKEVLESVLYDLSDTGVFGSADYPPMDELARQGGLSIIDLSDMVNMTTKQMMVSYIASKLFKLRRYGTIPPFLLVVEEAHQFAPETAKREQALSRGIITTIAREGRKFNASLCLISQRPIQLSTTALSQCNTNIILRVTNPYDLDHIGKSSEGITSDVRGQISTLPVGSGLIVGEAVNAPLFVSIRNRRSKESEKGLPLEKAALEYHRKVAQKRKDAKSFM